MQIMIAFPNKRVDTKEQQLWRRLAMFRGPFSSHDVIRIGQNIYYQRADRTCRQWASASVGILRRISTSECVLKGLHKKGKANLAWWEIA